MSKPLLPNPGQIKGVVDRAHPAAVKEGLNTFARADGCYLTTTESATYLHVSKSYLDKLRVYGGGPLFMRVGKRKILYRKSDLDEWAAQHRYRSTSEYER